MAPTLISLAGDLFSFLFFNSPGVTVVYWSLSEDEWDVARRKGPSPIDENHVRFRGL